MTTRVVPTPGGLRLNGRRFYSTGALFAHWIPTRALDADGRAVFVFARREAPGVSVVERLVGLRPAHDGERHGDLRGRGGGARGHPAAPSPRRAPEPRRADLAADPGRHRPRHRARSLADAVRYVRDHSRPWMDSGVGHASDDPTIRHGIGHLATLVEAAEAVTQETPRRSTRSPPSPSPSRVRRARRSPWPRPRSSPPRPPWRSARRCSIWRAPARRAPPMRSTGTGATRASTRCTIRCAGNTTSSATTTSTALPAPAFVELSMSPFAPRPRTRDRLRRRGARRGARPRRRIRARIRPARRGAAPAMGRARSLQARAASGASRCPAPSAGRTSRPRHLPRSSRSFSAPTARSARSRRTTSMPWKCCAFGGSTAQKARFFGLRARRAALRQRAGGDRRARLLPPHAAQGGGRPNASRRRQVLCTAHSTPTGSDACLGARGRPDRHPPRLRAPRRAGRDGERRLGRVRPARDRLGLRPVSRTSRSSGLGSSRSARCSTRRRRSAARPDHARAIDLGIGGRPMPTRCASCASGPGPGSTPRSSAPPTIP